MHDDNLEQRVALTAVAAVVSVLLIGAVVYAIRTVGGPGAPAGPAAAPPAAAAASAPAAPGARTLSLGTVRLSGDPSRITLSGTVPDEATRERLLKPARVLWGRGNVVDNLKVSADAPPLWWHSRPVDVLARLRQLGRFDLRTDRNTLTLAGSAPSEAVRSATSTGMTVWFVQPVQPQVDLSVDASGGDVAPSDSLLDERIEFATAESTLPEAAKPRLTEIAGLLKDDDRVIVITGHTDNQGSDRTNMPLSRARAESVMAFLVIQGVPVGHLRARGVGAEEPVADNGTEAGRARNRRISFGVGG